MFNIRVLFLLLAAMFASKDTMAYDFVPTRLEYVSWPKYCQVKYQVTNVGSASEYAGTASHREQEAMRSMLGTTTYSHVHHYCAAIWELERARFAPDPQKRKALINSAKDDAVYSFTRDPSDSPIKVSIGVLLSKIEQMDGRQAEALEILEGLVMARPNDAQASIALALAHRDLNDLTMSRQILEKARAVGNNPGLEIEYNLGLVCFQLRDYVCAKSSASIVYANGYPLSGLKTKLQELGRWP